jgi:DNA-binding beta-propeller fold protein YncE
MVTLRAAFFVGLLLLLSLSGASALAQTGEGANVEPVGDGLPNPYPNRTIDWARLPDGMKWGAVVGALPGRDGYLYVVHRCFENSCAGRQEPPMLVFDSAGKLIKTWGSGLVAFPHGYFMDPQGNIWLTDASGAGADTGGTHKGLGNQVLKLDANGRVLMTIGRAGVAGTPEQGLLTQPTAVITNRQGEIFIAEGHNGELANRISKFTSGGKFIRTIVGGGTAPGQVKIPHCLAFDAREYLYVCDRGNNRVSIFDQEGKLIAVWEQWGRPSGILIDGDRLYVTDSESGGTRNPGWKKGIRIGDARSGKVDAFVPDPEASTSDPSGAEGISLYHGALFGAVVRRRELERFTK